MSRLWMAGFMLGLLGLSSGCCMCNAPYDYCGPVYADYVDDPCMLIDERYGSAFSGAYADQPASYEGEVVSEESGYSVQQAPASPPPNTAPARLDDYYHGSVEPAPRTTQALPRMHSALNEGQTADNSRSAPHRGRAGR